MSRVTSMSPSAMNARVMEQVKLKAGAGELKSYEMNQGRITKVPYKPLSSVDSFEQMECMKKSSPDVNAALAAVEHETPELLTPEIKQAVKKSTHVCTFFDPSSDGSGLFQAVFVNRKGDFVSDLVVPIGFED